MRNEQKEEARSDRRPTALLTALGLGQLRGRAGEGVGKIDRSPEGRRGVGKSGRIFAHRARIWTSSGAIGALRCGRPRICGPGRARLWLFCSISRSARLNLAILGGAPPR